jgi:hypothetical protein
MPSLPNSTTAPTTKARAPIRRERALYTLALVLTALFWVPQAIRWMGQSDFGPHERSAASASESLWWAVENIPHFGLHVLSAGVMRLLNVDAQTAVAIVVTLAVLTLGALLYGVFRRALADDQPLSWRQGALVIGAVLTTLTAAPVALNPQNLYFGFFTPNVYHNPTVILMKPSAVALFFAGLACFSPKWRPQPLPLWVIGYALLTAVCLYSKPNFIIAWLPTLALITLYHLLSRRPVHWPLLIGGIVLPAGILLFAQAQSSVVSAGFGFAPFELYNLWAEFDANQDLLLKRIGSILFPLLVYLLCLPQSSHSLTFNAAWLTFFVSSAYADLLIDLYDPGAGNFIWGAQFGVFLLFVVATAALMQQCRQRSWRDWRLVVIGLALTGHTLAGINWYYLHLTRPVWHLLVNVW